MEEYKSDALKFTQEILRSPYAKIFLFATVLSTAFISGSIVRLGEGFIPLVSIQKIVADFLIYVGFLWVIISLARYSVVNVVYYIVEKINDKYLRKGKVVAYKLTFVTTCVVSVVAMAIYGVRITENDILAAALKKENAVFVSAVTVLMLLAVIYNEKIDLIKRALFSFAFAVALYTAYLLGKFYIDTLERQEPNVSVSLLSDKAGFNGTIVHATSYGIIFFEEGRPRAVFYNWGQVKSIQYIGRNKLDW